MPEITSMTVAELQAALRSGRLSVAEIAAAYLARIERYGGAGKLNAVRELDGEIMARAKRMDDVPQERRGLLFGIPLLIKDNIDVAGLHTTAGSVALADNIARRDAPIVANLRGAGALILGKANMTEFANFVDEKMPNGFSSLGGQVVSAYGAEDPYGSSTGSAVAVSAGLCAAALGTDTSFSIVGCATVNGVVGIKPPFGAVPLEGIVPIAPTLDNPGPFAKNVADALLVYDAMRGAPSAGTAPIAAKELRIASNTFDREDVSDAQRARYEALLDALRRDGCAVAEVCHPKYPAMWDIMRCEFREGLNEYLAGSSAKLRDMDAIIAQYERNPQNMPYGIGNFTASRNMSRAEGAYAAAMEERRGARARMLEELRDFDACLMTGWSDAMHFAGLPSIAIPLGVAQDGTPRGAVLYGADERRLFAAALTLERYCDPVPPPSFTNF